MSTPPRVTERLLAHAVAGTPFAEDIVGDLRESHDALAAQRSPRYAAWWYRAQAIRLASRYIVRRRPVMQKRGSVMDRLVMDIRYAMRALLKRPATTAAIVATLALGIGANAAVFGVIDAMLLHPFTMKDVDRIVMPMTVSPRFGEHRETVSPADFLDWRRALAGGSIEHVSASEWWDANLVGRDEPERVLGFRVSPAFFAAFDGRAALGRTFLPEEEIEANSRRAILSDGLWKRRFGGDPAIVGQTVLIDGLQWQVVGVMPASFTFPQNAEIWAPWFADEKTARNRSAHYLTIFGRLAGGRSIEEARAQMATVAKRLAADHPETNAELTSDVLTLSRGMADVGVPQVLALWQAAGLFVLLIACANIANLLLARAAERGREIAIRLALGSSRGRIVRESLVESVLLAAMAIPLALAVAAATLRVIQAAMPARIVRFVAGWDRLGLDAWTIGGTIACAAIAAVVFGTLPAAHMAHGVVVDALKSDGRTGAGPGRQRVRRALVVAEVALALPLLVAAMLSVSTIQSFITGWQGYDPNNVLTLRAVLPASRYPDAGSQARFAEQVVERLSAIPGARIAAVGNVTPAIDANAVRAVDVTGQPLAELSKWPRVNYRLISPRYFDVLRLPLPAGRAFTTADRAGSEEVAIVSESMARKFWPNGDAIGGRVRLASGGWIHVVGICGDVVHDWFNGRVPTLYRPLAQTPTDTPVFALRADGDPLALASAARSAIAQVDPTQPVFDVMTARQVLNDRTISLKFIASVMASFAGLALLLALLGLYAVMTYFVQQRAREIGVRMALGATGSDVTWLTLSQGARLTLTGVAIGLMLAVGLSRAMEAGLLGIVTSDIRLTLALAAGLAATALVATYLPARRAASVDPMIALRSE